ncbi:hypothetical protein LXA47_01105, partial [Massilia sp. P8910]|uniref:hypothetical protein n=1 Tax=Massilia antarctica TaxID=2765360 RepID=UPI001E5A4212
MPNSVARQLEYGPDAFGVPVLSMGSILTGSGVRPLLPFPLSLSPLEIAGRLGRYNPNEFVTNAAISQPENPVLQPGTAAVVSDGVEGRAPLRLEYSDTQGNTAATGPVLPLNLAKTNVTGPASNLADQLAHESLVASGAKLSEI